MKKIYLTYILLSTSLIGYTQSNLEIFLNNTWKLEKAVINQQDVFPPITDFQEESIFQNHYTDGNLTFTQSECEFHMIGNYSIINETSFTYSSLVADLSSCTGTPFHNFYNSLNNFVFFLSASFTYNIISENNATKLIITGDTGNSAHYTKDKPLKTNDFTKNQLIVYPNPSSDFLNVSISDLDKIEIFDMLGKRIEAKYSSSENTTQIDIQQLAKGNYILQLTKGTQTENIKFIKE